MIDETDINDLFQKISSRYAEAEKDFDKILTSTENVLNKGRSFKEKFLKLDTSFYMIVSALGAKGVSLESPEAVKMFGEIIEKKRELTTERDAWEQYEHLASWLAHLGALIEIKGRSIEQKYLSAVQYSMEKMSKKKLLGYSWHAYRQWEAKWKNMQASNRALIKYHIEENSTDPDALTIVNLR